MERTEALQDSEQRWVDNTLEFFKDDWETLNWLERTADVNYKDHVVTIKIPFTGRWRGLRETYRREVK